MRDSSSLKQPPTRPHRDEAIAMWVIEGKWRWRASIFRPGDKNRTIVAEGRETSPVFAAVKAQQALEAYWRKQEA
jgi:hypothetical protein